MQPSTVAGNLIQAPTQILKGIVPLRFGHDALLALERNPPAVDAIDAAMRSASLGQLDRGESGAAPNIQNGPAVLVVGHVL